MLFIIPNYFSKIKGKKKSFIIYIEKLRKSFEIRNALFSGIQHHLCRPADSGIVAQRSEFKFDFLI